MKRFYYHPQACRPCSKGCGRTCPIPTLRAWAAHSAGSEQLAWLLAGTTARPFSSSALCSSLFEEGPQKAPASFIQLQYSALAVVPLPRPLLTSIVERKRDTQVEAALLARTLLLNSSGCSYFPCKISNRNRMFIFLRACVAIYAALPSGARHF